MISLCPAASFEQHRPDHVGLGHLILQRPENCGQLSNNTCCPQNLQIEQETGAHRAFFPPHLWTGPAKILQLGKMGFPLPAEMLTIPHLDMRL
jgi:hypothetical protein